MKNNFKTSLKHVLVHEGGYVDHPRDPGGATNKGVTLATFRRFYGNSMTKADLKAITDEQLEKIYRTGYWDKCRCDDLPNGVDYVVFDQAVNSGPGRSAKWLQAAVGERVDGSIGDRTVEAALGQDADDTVNAMCDNRLAFLKSLSHWSSFGRGWSRRVAGVRAYGLELASGETDIAPSVDYEVVALGDSGEWVKKLQQALGLVVDGDFGPKTEKALKEYQTQQGLEADGIAGRKTYQALGLIAS